MPYYLLKRPAIRHSTGSNHTVLPFLTFNQFKNFAKGLVKNIHTHLVLKFDSKNEIFRKK